MRLGVPFGYNKTVDSNQARGMTKHSSQAAKVQRDFQAWKDKQKKTQRHEENAGEDGQ